MPKESKRKSTIYFKIHQKIGQAHAGYTDFTVRFFQLLQMCYNSYNKMLGKVYHYTIVFIFMSMSYFLTDHILNKE